MGGTAWEFAFLSHENETRIANVVIVPDVFERNRIDVTRSCLLPIEGPLQNQDGMIQVKAQRFTLLNIASANIAPTTLAELWPSSTNCWKVLISSEKS